MTKKSVYVGISYSISMCTGENAVYIYWKESGKPCHHSYHIKCNGGGMGALKKILNSKKYKCTIVSVNPLLPDISYQITER